MCSRLLGFLLYVSAFKKSSFKVLNLKISKLYFRKLSLSLGISLAVMSLVATSAQATQTIVIFGDSLSAAYGIQQNEGWVKLLENKLNQQKLDYKVVNASISGETTSGGLGRFKTMLTTHKPNIVIIELGANDGLRGLSVREMQSNLDGMITQAKATKAKVLLLGMRIPPNYGIQYTQQFSETYANLAQKHGLVLVPFFLEGVAGNPSLILDDGLHPKAIAQDKLLENVWSQLRKLIK
ncbi:arylesterase [Methylotenera versatilis]|uniref:arylesterase n=1 Tax=Methylotenera versatilis TaxID=1055487 RepID=UPI00064572EB|nr:arylesterase [Methylotenera versatilis]